jgi:hypothetical protein
MFPNSTANLNIPDIILWYQFWGKTAFVCVLRFVCLGTANRWDFVAASDKWDTSINEAPSGYHVTVITQKHKRISNIWKKNF